jgi:hypothetical protein
VENPQPPGPGSPKLDVVLADGRGDDDGVGGREMRGVVADVDLGSFGGQGGQHERVLGVGPTDGHPSGEHHPGDTGHACASDGYEVDRAQAGRGRDLGGEVEALVGAVGQMVTR